MKTAMQMYALKTAATHSIVELKQKILSELHHTVSKEFQPYF